MAVFEGETSLSMQAAREEATRCLFCYDAPCVAACPTGIDVPGFIHAIATGNLDGSARTILAANPLGGTCARVCPVESLCEGACVRVPLDGPVKIGALQRVAMDAYRDAGRPFFVPGAATGKRVAVVGAGPAGLACAAELRRHGIDVTIFEARAKAGGLAAYGIVPWRHARDMTAHEVAEVERAGVEIRRGTRVGEAGAGDAAAGATGPTATELLAEYDAVFLGLGLGRSRRLGVPGEGLEGVVDALTLLEPVVTGEAALDGEGPNPVRGRRVGVDRRRKHGDGRGRGRRPAGRRRGHGLLPSRRGRGARVPARDRARALAGRPIPLPRGPGRGHGHRRPCERRRLRHDAPGRAGRQRPCRAPGHSRGPALRRARRDRRGHRAGVPRASRRRVRGGGARRPGHRRPGDRPDRQPARVGRRRRRQRWPRGRRRRPGRQGGGFVNRGGARRRGRPRPRRDPRRADPGSGSRRQPGGRAGRHSQPQPVLAGQRTAHQHRRDGRPRLRGRLGRRRLEDRRRPDHERELAPGLALGGWPAHDRHLEHRADQRPPDRDEPGRGPRGQAPLPGSRRRGLADGRVEAGGLARHRQPGQRHRRRRHRAQLRLPARDGRAGDGVGRRPGPRVHRADHRLGEEGLTGSGPRQAHPEHHRHHRGRARGAAGRRRRGRAHQHDQLARRARPRYLGDAPVRPRAGLARRLLGSGRQADRPEHGQLRSPRTPASASRSRASAASRPGRTRSSSCSSAPPASRSARRSCTTAIASWRT